MITTHQEFLAVTLAVLLLHPYLEGTRFIIRTGHDAQKLILNLVDATGKLGGCQLWSSEMEFNVTLRALNKPRAANALSRLSTTGEDQLPKPMDDALPTMSIFPSSEEDRKVGTKTTDIIDYYDENGFNFISPGLPAVSPIVTSNPETNTTPPTLNKLLAGQAKDAFCQQVEATAGMPSSCYLYYHRVILVRFPLDGMVQTEEPNSLQPHLFTSLVTSNWRDTRASVACTTP